MAVKQCDNSAPDRPAVLPRWCSTAVLGPLLILVGLRPLIQESHDSALNPFSAILSGVADPLPEVTLWLNLCIVVFGGAGIVIGLCGGRRSYRRTGLELGFALVLCAALAAIPLASNKRLALNATIDWLTLPLLAMALVQILRQRWQQWLMLAVVVASGVASAVESYDQVFFTLPQTVEMYEHNKEQLWRQKGTDLSSYQVELFERRLREGAANGFFAYANIAGSYLILTIFAAAALSAAAWSDLVRAALPALLVATMFGAMLLTRSRGAVAATLLAAGLLAAAVVFRDRIVRHRRAVFVTGWVVVAAVLSAVAGFGVAKGYLPGGSLTYRWWYLETTADMFAEHPWGIGAEQYARYYPHYKQIKSPEEITNPHNFLAHGAAEWGIGGLLGIILMVVGSAWRFSGLGGPLADSTVPGGDDAVPANSSRSPPRPAGSNPWLWSIALLVAIWTLRICIVGSDSSDYIIASNTFPLLGWVLALVLCAAAAMAVGQQWRAISPAAVLGIGVLGFAVHNLISFSLFVPGSATTCFAVLAVGVAMRYPAAARPPPRFNRAAIAAIAATIVVASAIVVCGVVPVALCRRHLQSARQTTDPSLAAAHYRAALEADRLDPVPAIEWSRLIAGTAVNEPQATDEDAANAACHSARLRDPENVAVLRLCAALAYRTYQHTGNPEQLDFAVQFYSEAVDRYPTNPPDRVALAELHVRRYQLAGEGRDLEAAIVQLDEALRLDRMRTPDEVRRFRHEQVQQLETERDRLRRLHPS